MKRGMEPFLVLNRTISSKSVQSDVIISALYSIDLTIRDGSIVNTFN